MVCHRRDVRRPGACGVGPGGARNAARTIALLHRISEARRLIRRLGGGLSAGVRQPECAAQARRAGHADAVDFGRASALCAHHGAARGSGQSAAARHAQGDQRGRGSPGFGEARRDGGHKLVANASRLLPHAAAARAMDSRRRLHDQAAVWRTRGRGGELQPAQAGPAVALLSHRHAVEFALGARG